jgi:hypothetical protein
MTDKETIWNLLMRQSHCGPQGHGGEWSSRVDHRSWIVSFSGEEPEWGWFFAAWVNNWTLSVLKECAP